MQYYCQRILKLEKRKNLQTLKIYENYYWDSLKFYLFAKKWLALKETKQLEKKESDALILEQFYQHKDFPPRPLGEKAWQPYQKLLHKWLSSILELKQENPALHTSFQTSLCEMRIYGSHLLYGDKLAIYSSPANFKLKRKLFFGFNPSNRIQVFLWPPWWHKKRCLIQKKSFLLSLKFAGLL